MAEIGKYNTLTVVRTEPQGIYLFADNLGEVLLPNRYVPDGTSIGTELEVFLYLDSEDRLIATTEKPRALVGEFAYLQAIDINRVGAFLDWGLPKDLLVPFREQKKEMEKGKSYIVYVYLDHESQRITASPQLNKFLDNIPPDYSQGQEVEIMIAHKSEFGYNVIVNNLHWGLIYDNEIFRAVRTGQKTVAYIKKVREDDKIDLSLSPQGYGKIDNEASKILEILKKRDGFLPLTDKSPAEIIYGKLQMSKKNFKKAIGALYKKRLITIEKNGIKMTGKG